MATKNPKTLLFKLTSQNNLKFLSCKCVWTCFHEEYIIIRIFQHVACILNKPFTESHRVLLEKLTVPSYGDGNDQCVQGIPSFYEQEVRYRVHRNSPLFHVLHMSKSILQLFRHLRSDLPFSFPEPSSICISHFLLCVLHVPPNTPFLSPFSYVLRSAAYTIWSSFSRIFPPSVVNFPLGPKTLHSYLFSNTLIFNLSSSICSSFLFAEL
jgi:hypothetical protein